MGIDSPEDGITRLMSCSFATLKFGFKVINAADPKPALVNARLDTLIIFAPMKYFLLPLAYQ